MLKRGRYLPKKIQSSHLKTNGIAATVEFGNKFAWPNKHACLAKKALKCDLQLFRNGSVHEFFRLKALTTLEQVNTSLVEKKKNKTEES